MSNKEQKAGISQSPCSTLRELLAQMLNEEQKEKELALEMDSTVDAFWHTRIMVLLQKILKLIDAQQPVA